MKEKKIPDWVLEKQNLNKKVHEPIILVGELGADAVIDGKLPSGEQYEGNKRFWRKRKNK
jgi:hypothetical protein